MVDSLENELDSKNDWFQVTEIWKSFSWLKLEKPSNVLWIRRAFWDKILKILREQKILKRWTYNWNDNKKKWYYDAFKPTSNGDILINPNFIQQDNFINIIWSQIWYYQTYHTFNWLKNWLWDWTLTIDELKWINYKVLSAWWLIFDKQSESFILFKRPDNSQEAPWEIDLIGWCMNMKDWLDEDLNPNPAKFTSQRISHKTWINLNSNDYNLLWIQWFKKRGFYNIVYLWFIDWVEKDNEKKDNYSLIHISEVEKYIKQDNPGWAWLLLSLSHPYFERYWWWAEKVKELQRKKS